MNGTHVLEESFIAPGGECVTMTRKYQGCFEITLRHPSRKFTEEERERIREKLHSQPAWDLKSCNWSPTEDGLITHEGHFLSAQRDIVPEVLSMFKEVIGVWPSGQVLVHSVQEITEVQADLSRCEEGVQN